MTSIKNLGLVIKPGIEDAATLGASVVEWAKTKGWTVCGDPQTEQLLANDKIAREVSPVWLEDLAARSDIVVALGGDGTLIGIARYVTAKPCLMVGVNFGTLGFLTEIRPEELLVTLEKVVSGAAIIGERSMLDCRVRRSGKDAFVSQALNDLVIHKGTKDRLLDIDILVDAHPLARVRADGLIVATPTGSTAYSLAAGGSIVHPEIPVTLITPICPHSLTIRPLIVRSDSKVEIRFPPYDGEIVATVDGQVSHMLEGGDTVLISQATNKVSFVRSPSRTYFDVLTAKLNWGIPNRAY